MTETILDRGKFGFKPLYYTVHGGKLYHAATVREVLEASGRRAEVDPDGMLEYFTFQNYLSDRTLFKGVKLVPAGCRLHFPSDDPASVRFDRYWQPHFAEPEKELSGEEYQRRLLDKLSWATYCPHGRAGGVFLSGGIDSGCVAALVSDWNKCGGYLPPPTTFTVGFDESSSIGLEQGRDERANAERIAHHVQSEHYEIVLKGGDMRRCLPALIDIIEEPRLGQSYPNYFAMKLASKHCKTVLGGTGGDELFGGYPWRYWYTGHRQSYFLDWIRLAEARHVAHMLKVPIRDFYSRQGSMIRRAFPSHRCSSVEERLNACFNFEFSTFGGSLLVLDWKLANHFGVDVRYPFLDEDLVEFAMSLPARHKVDWTADPPTGKVLLRKVAEKLLPRGMAHQPKQGFTGPDGSWFKGEAVCWVNELVFGKGEVRMWDYLDRTTVRELVADHVQGRVNRRLLLWSLLCFEEWLRRWIR